MKALIQRVKHASVTVEQKIVGRIETGVLIFLGIEKTDTLTQGQSLIDRILNYRIFADAAGKMNLSVIDQGGGVLLVSQFTLVADTRKGLRPGFSAAAKSAHARALFEQVLNYTHTCHNKVESGIFGADMAVDLINDGPVTFYLESQR